jgi:hypothetical protein
MPTHFVVRTTAVEDVVNAAIKENEAKGAGLIQVLPITLEHSTSEVMLVFRTTEEASRPAGFRYAADLDK